MTIVYYPNLNKTQQLEALDKTNLSKSAQKKEKIYINKLYRCDIDQQTNIFHITLLSEQINHNSFMHNHSALVDSIIDIYTYFFVIITTYHA